MVIDVFPFVVYHVYEGFVIATQIGIVLIWCLWWCGASFPPSGAKRSSHSELSELAQLKNEVRITMLSTSAIIVTKLTYVRNARKRGFYRRQGSVPVGAFS